MKVITILLILAFPFFVHAKSTLHEKYPNGLLTDDYGILKETDLHADNLRRWQCFETKKVLFHYSTWRDIDPSGPSNVVVTLCDFSFRVTDLSGVKHMYYARRVREVEGCKMAFREWKKIRKGERYVCISGEAGDYTDGIKGWVWGKIKTKKKCMAYFDNECELETIKK